MTAAPTKRKRPIPIGTYLCERTIAEPIEHIDFPSLNDVKQEAALRALVALRKRKCPVDDDPVAAFDSEPRLVAVIYQRTRVDMMRVSMGRGGGNRALLVRSGLESVPDPAQDARLYLAESDAAFEVRKYEQFGLPGLSLDQTRRVLAVMRRIQHIKSQPNATVPVALRQQVSRLRKETGLPLDTRLL